jgi:hypothetical protein
MWTFATCAVVCSRSFSRTEVTVRFRPDNMPHCSSYRRGKLPQALHLAPFTSSCLYCALSLMKIMIDLRSRHGIGRLQYLLNLHNAPSMEFLIPGFICYLNGAIRNHLNLQLKKGDLMMKLVFNVALLVLITIGLTPLPAKTTSLAAPAPASAAVACDFQSCMTKCVKLGYLGGTCGSITHTCVCYSYPPPPNQEP